MPSIRYYLETLKTKYNAVLVPFDGWVLCWEGKHKFLTSESITGAGAEALKFLRKEKARGKEKKAKV